MNNFLKAIFVILFSTGIVFMGMAGRLLEVKIGDTQIRAEVAETHEEQRIGLMNRESLGTNRGMLFIYPEERPITFWMKNTLIPLDMIFIDDDKKIIHIEENAQPCRAETDELCEKYASPLPSQYVLEVNAGFVQKHGVQTGQNVEF